MIAEILAILHAIDSFIADMTLVAAGKTMNHLS
jgi:hypothetical protein